MAKKKSESRVNQMDVATLNASLDVLSLASLDVLSLRRIYLEEMADEISTQRGIILVKFRKLGVEPSPRLTYGARA